MSTKQKYWTLFVAIWFGVVNGTYRLLEDLLYLLGIGGDTAMLLLTLVLLASFPLGWFAGRWFLEDGLPPQEEIFAKTSREAGAET